MLRPEHTAAQKTPEQHSQQPGQRKADPREEDLRHHILALDREEAIAELDAGRSAAPEKIGQHRRRDHAKAGRKEVSLVLFCVHSCPLLSGQRSARPFFR